MRHLQPAVLSGHTRNLPLSDVVDILRHRHQSGRLAIEYPKQHCVLHFESGELVDARMGDARGLDAVTQVEGQPDAPFTFAPSAAPPDASINSVSREAALRALGCWQDAAIFNTEPLIAAPADTVLQNTLINLRRKLSERRGHAIEPYGTIPEARRARRYPKRAAIYAGVLAAVLVGASAIMLAWLSGGEAVAPTSEVGNVSPAPPSSPSTLIEATPLTDSSTNQSAAPATTEDDSAGGISPHREQVNKQPRVTQTYRREYEGFTTPVPVKTRQPSAVNTELPPPVRSSSSPTATSTPATTAAAATPRDVTVTIVTRIENGRVVQAQVANPRPGMEAFEASALRAARQRRYPASTTGSDQVRIKISKQ